MHYLSAPEVWDMHLAVADRAGRIGKPFDPVCRDRALLESAVHQPRQSFGGADLYPSVFDKAAALARGIICAHVFLDGNKRTGLAAAAVFLADNGWELSLPQDDLVSLGVDIAGAREQGREPLSIPEIAERLREGSESTAS